MSITLTHPTAGAGGTPLALTLPPDLIWTDEFAWQKVEQALEYGLTGALLIDEAVKQAGRPLTLAGEVTHGWILRGALKTLKAWSSQAGLQMQLTRMSETHTLIWSHEEGAIEAAPIVPYSDPIDGDYYSLTLRFRIL